MVQVKKKYIPVPLQPLDTDLVFALSFPKVTTILNFVLIIFLHFFMLLPSVCIFTAYILFVLPAFELYLNSVILYKFMVHSILYFWGSSLLMCVCLQFIFIAVHYYIQNSFILLFIYIWVTFNFLLLGTILYFGAHLYLSIVSLSYLPRHGMDGLIGMCMFNFTG